MVSCSINLQCPLKQTACCQRRYARVVQITRRPVRYRHSAKSDSEKRQRAARQRKNKGIEHKIGIHLMAEMLVDSAKQDTEQRNKQIDKSRLCRASIGVVSNRYRQCRSRSFP